MPTRSIAPMALLESACAEAMLHRPFCRQSSINANSCCRQPLMDVAVTLTSVMKMLQSAGVPAEPASLAGAH